MRDPAVGEVIGRYRVLTTAASRQRVLAYDPDLERRIELRVIDIASRDDAEVELMLERVRVRAGCKHPHLSAIHDGWREASRLLVALEHLDDPSIRQWIERRSLDEERIELVAGELARILAWLHARGTVHGGIDLDVVHLSKRGVLGVESMGRDFLALEPLASGPEEDIRAFGRLLESMLAASGNRRTGWLSRVAAGCSGNAAGAFSKMEQVMAALQASPRRRRGRVLAGLALVTVVGVAIAGFRITTWRSGATCRDGQTRIDAVWSEERRARIHSAFEATGVDFARTSRERVLEGLDGWADEWIRSWTDTCVEAEIDGTLTEVAAEARRACLESGLYSLGATVEVLGLADLEVVTRSARTVAELERPTNCLDHVGRATRGESVERELAMVAALRAVGRYEEGRDRAATLVERARSSDDRALEAEALEAEGYLTASAGHPELGAAKLQSAIVAAWDSEQDDVAARAWLELVYTMGEHLGLPARADEAAVHALAAIERLGGDPGLLADLRGYEVVVAIGQANYGRAIERSLENLELLERQHGPNDERVGSALNNLANAYLGLDRHEEALASYERALAIWSASLGPLHPDSASLHNNRGAVFLRRNDLVAAELELTKAYEIRRQSLGPKHPLVGASVDNLGVVADAKGDVETALRFHRQAFEIKRAAHGERHPAVADTLLNIGNALQSLGKVDEALLDYRLAGNIYSETLGPKHPHLGLALHNQGRALQALGRHEDALALHEQAFEIRMTALGAEHQSTMTSLARVAECLQVLGRDDALVARLDHQLATTQSAHTIDDARAEVEYLLALALQARNDPRAEPLARAALTRTTPQTPLQTKLQHLLPPSRR